jgi:flagellum-specific peptidoglycan hydrolase FlgJ
MNTIQIAFLLDATAEAVKAAHPFPQMAACEAALESNFGLSELARDANNLFGMKIHRHNVYGEMALPTREFENSEWIVVPGAEWEKYPDVQSCFADRRATLYRLSNLFPHYKRAIEAGDPRSYVIQVSESWSTDPGWECTCCVMLGSEAEAQQHAKDNPGSAEHAQITRIEGLGRALKVLSIYDEYTAG